MKKLYYKLSHIGIDQATPFSLRNKLTVFNNASIVIFIISIFYFFVGLVDGFYYGCLFTLFSAFSNAYALYLIGRGRHLFAFHFTMVYSYIFLSAFSVLFGGANNSYYYFLFLPVACNILFDEKRIAVGHLIASCFLMLANVFYIEHFEPYYQLKAWMHYLGYPNVVFAILLVFLGVRLFKRENLSYAAQIEAQRKVMEEKNEEITDSINYAKKIQMALLPSEEEFTANFKEAFVLLIPKDIVSGDFYWTSKKGDSVFYATADCTGHGVPGGFMTMLGLSFLDEIVNEKDISRPDEILNLLRDKIIHTLKQTGTAGESKDGMDIALCCINTQTLIMNYAAANNSVYLLRDTKLSEYKPDKQPCGFHHNLKPFTPYEIPLRAGDCVYTFSDGYADQFGGEKGKKFKYKKLEELLLRSSPDFKKQKELLNRTFLDWKGELEQVDDILLIGVRV